METKPVKIQIDGVFLQAGPLDISTIGSEELKRAALQSKRSRIQLADDMLYKKMQSLQEEGTDASLHNKVKNTTYMQQLTIKIIDNLEVTLSNIHIRYEDSMTIPTKTFSFGFTISLITLISTDENWKEVFIKRDMKREKDHETRKLGKMENFGIYWDVNAEHLFQLSGITWESAMAGMIFPGASTAAAETNSSLSPLHESLNLQQLKGLSGNHSPTTPTGGRSRIVLPYKSYLLEPKNDLTVKILHRNTSTSTSPLIDIVIESSLVPLDFDKHQFRQIKATGLSYIILLIIRILVLISL